MLIAIVDRPSAWATGLCSRRSADRSGRRSRPDRTLADAGAVELRLQCGDVHAALLGKRPERHVLGLEAPELLVGDEHLRAAIDGVDPFEGFDVAAYDECRESGIGRTYGAGGVAQRQRVRLRT